MATQVEKSEVPQTGPDSKDDRDIKMLEVVAPSELSLPSELADRSEEDLKRLNAKTTRRLDMTLLPCVAILSIMNSLDRTSISTAKLGGLEKDLHMSNHQYNTCIMVFYIAYCITQIPSNLILTRVHPPTYICSCAIAWGTVCLAQGFTHNFAGLVACRFLLGLIEAPFIPGYQFILSCWYTREELPFRLAWLFGAEHIATAFGGVLAAGILNGMDGAGGLSGWCWLFIILGALTAVFAMIAWSLLPGYPGNKQICLSREMSLFGEWRVRKENAGIEDIDVESILWGTKQALIDPKLYMLIALRIMISNMGGFTNFFPTIVSTLGYGTTKTLLLTAPPWMFAVIASFIVSYTGARWNERGYHILVCAIFSIIGNLLLMFVNGTGARYFSMFVVAGAASAPHNLVTSWESSTLPRPRAKRAAAFAIINTLSAGVTHWYSSNAFPDSQQPRYYGGGTMMTVSAFFFGVFAMFIKCYLKRENKKFELAEGEGVLGGRGLEGARAGHGNEAVMSFRYVT